MRESSIIVPTRGHGDDLELFWSQRSHDMAFLGGMWAFAGGAVEDADADAPLSAGPEPGFPTRRAYGCAAREVFEELGLWVTDRGVRHVSESAELARLRDRIGDDAGAWVESLRERGERVAVDRLWPIGTWLTPEWFEVRFDSEFFALQLTADENERFGAALADHMQTSELIAGEWRRPADALDAWLRGERWISPPIRLALEELERHGDVHDVEIDRGDIRRYDIWKTTGGLYMVPLRTPTIPPATRTNAAIVGEDRFVVVDPGSPDRREQALLEDLLDQMIADDRTFDAVVLTHHHVDHVSGVGALTERYGVPVWAHENTPPLVDFEVDRLLRDGDRIELGVDSLECLHTPGHASDHLCFRHQRTGAILAGDLVAAPGTILVNPPDGHMGDYLASLARVRELAPSALLPAHGWIVPGAEAMLDHYTAHRLAREEKVLAALRQVGESSAPDLVPIAYDDAPKAVWPIAARSAEAHLIHLVELGRAVRTAGGYRAV